MRPDPASQFLITASVSLMNSTLPANYLGRYGAGLQPGLYSDHMLAESLALHSATLALLRAKLFGGENNANFFADQIQQADASADRRRAPLDHHEAQILPATR